MSSSDSFPTPSPSWSQDEPAHPGYELRGADDTLGRKAYFIHLEAKPGKEELVMAFMRDINAGVNLEPGTGPWFGMRFSQTSFAIFEAFEDTADRNAHNVGPGGQNFQRVELLRDMLAWPAQIYRLDIMHGKFGVLFGKEVQTAKI